jgi:GNAT superfamily N-acetyltransferase
MGIVHKVRRAGIEDLDVLSHLFDGYRVFYEQPSNPDAARVFLHDRLERGESVIFLAEDDQGNGCGFTQLYPLFSSVRMKPIWVLNDLFVAPSARKSGVANLLMAAAEDWGRREGAAGLELATAKDNGAAKSVYHARGWLVDNEFDHYSITL